MPKEYLKIDLATKKITASDLHDFDSALSGHNCDPTQPDCRRFRGLTVTIHQDKKGDLILAVNKRSKPKK